MDPASRRRMTMSDPMLRCRGCDGALGAPFLDLGPTPLANSYLRAEDLWRSEPFYPLTVHVCPGCFLVQVPAVESPAAIFAEYAYFSSYSTTWLKHVEAYAARMVEGLGLGRDSLVIELASNDGYLLQFFNQRQVPVLGVEPAKNVARAAEAAGIPTLVDFFGPPLAERLVREGRQADLVVANNVLAHVPDLNGFVSGIRRVLKPHGLVTLEFPHLLRLMDEHQFARPVRGGRGGAHDPRRVAAGPRPSHGVASGAERARGDRGGPRGSRRPQPARALRRLRRGGA